MNEGERLGMKYGWMWIVLLRVFFGLGKYVELKG